MMMAFSNGTYSSTELQRAYEDCCKADVVKLNLIQQMINTIRTLEEQLTKESTHLEHQNMLVATYHKKFKDIEGELNIMKTRQDQSSFVVVLLDGDLMLFQDQYIKKGEKGGAEAALELKVAVEQYLNSINLASKIVVRIYANISGLQKLYGPADVYGFIRGFNMVDGLYEIIEAGYGKECSDEKVKKSFEIFVKDVQCKHIIFGGSGDNGYARLLSSYVGEEKITLLEGPPFERELAKIADRFHKTTFKSVFRSAKIELPLRPAPGLVPPVSPTLEKQAMEISSPVRKPPGTWAAAVSTAVPTPHATEPINSPRRSSHPFVNGFEILRNANDERVDPPSTVSLAEIQKIKARKLCNHYHFFNSCAFEADACGHAHGARLNDREFLAQRALARRSVCRAGLSCSDPWCTSGHQCSAGRACIPEKCWFSKDMHEVDTKVVTVDGLRKSYVNI